MRITHLSTIALALTLTACVDTTGLSAQSSKGPHPQSNADAVVQVVEYGDLQCPSCQSAQTGVVEPLLAQFGSQIRFEFRQFPLSSIHRYALVAAQASECAADQGRFWEFLDMAYEKQAELDRPALSTWATELKLDMDLFERCVDSEIKRDAVIAEYDEGKTSGVGGTPTFFVNGQGVVMEANDSVQKAVQAALDAVKASL